MTDAVKTPHVSTAYSCVQPACRVPQYRHPDRLAVIWLLYCSHWVWLSIPHFPIIVGNHCRFPKPEPLKNIFLMVAVPKELQTNREIRDGRRKDQRSRYNHLSWKTVDDWQAVDICCSFFSLVFWIIGHKTPCSHTLAVSEREREKPRKDPHG